MYRFVYLEDYFRHTFLSSWCLITEVIIVADSEEVNRFSEQFVCEIFNYLGTLARWRTGPPGLFLKNKNPAISDGVLYVGGAG